MFFSLIDDHAWVELDRGIFEAQLMRAMLRPSLRIAERHQILQAFEKAPETAWRALDQTWLPPELTTSRDPVILALRRFAAGQVDGLDPLALEHFARAHHTPLGFLRAVIAEAIGLSRGPALCPEEAIAPLHVAATLLTPELERDLPQHYADLNARLLLEIAGRLQERGAPSWLAVLADAREELEHGTGDGDLRRAYLHLAQRAAVKNS